MAHAQKPDLVFQRNGRVHINRRGCQFSRLLAVEECWSADSNFIDRVPTYSGRLLATHSIRIFPLHFPSRASPCAIRFRTRYTFLFLHNTVYCRGIFIFYFLFFILLSFFSPTVACCRQDHILFRAWDKQIAPKPVEIMSVFVHGCDSCCISVNKNSNTEVSSYAAGKSYWVTHTHTHTRTHTPHTHTHTHTHAP